MEPKVIFEDNELLVLDKPSGWIVNVAQTTKGQKVLQTWIKNNVKSPISDNRFFRSGIVHRLDKETSGILLVAKTEEAFRSLQGQFKERIVGKTYTALAHGKVEPKEGKINAPVGRLPWNRERFGVIPGGRNAETAYKVTTYYTLHSACYALLELYPKTGRTHQIRVHLKHLGYPVVADEFYAGRKRSRSDRMWCPRLFLHASAISFKHPKTNKEISLSSPLPGDLSGALKKLKVPNNSKV
jgi:23S rRNA pseudouridine1911/1915/1917 synthase